MKSSVSEIENASFIGSLTCTDVQLLLNPFVHCLPHSSFYKENPTQIKAETWHITVISIILFQIECAVAQSLQHKDCVIV